MNIRETMHRLVLLSGPSCAGKSPLLEALGQMYPDLRKRFRKPVPYHSRDPRPDETDGEDYHFRSRDEIESMAREDEDVLTFDVRGDIQAIDLGELADLLREGDVFYEGNGRVSESLMNAEALEGIDKLSIYLSPLSMEEIRALQGKTSDLAAVITDIQRRKLVRRTAAKHVQLTLPALQDIENRSSAAFDELRRAHRFDHVIPNHDGEDSENWDAFPCPVGDARRATQTLAALLEGRAAPHAEKWPPDLFA